MSYAADCMRSVAVGGLALTLCSGVIAQETGQSADTADLPPASALFERCFMQMTTEDAMEQITSVSYAVTTPEAMGPAAATVSVLPPDKCRIDADFGGQKAYIVNNGEHVWAQGPGDPVEYGPETEIVMMTLLFSPQYFLHTAPYKYQPTTSGVEKIGDADCYRVDLKDGEDATDLALFFNTATGVCAGLEAPTDMGAPVVYTFDKWEEMNGIKILTQATARFGEGPVPPMTFGFKDFVFNGVDAKVFEMPDDVKKLAADANEDKADRGDGDRNRN